MGNANLTTSSAGFDMLKKEEAVIDGLYDDQSGYCTYGVGDLIHKKHSYLLRAASADKAWSSYIQKKWAGTKSETKFLSRQVQFDKKFDTLVAAAKALGKSEAGADKHIDAEVKILAETPDSLLKKRLSTYEAGVRTAINGVNLTQDEFDALISFEFNVGVHAFAGSTLAKKINAGKFDSGDINSRKTAIAEIEAAFKAWNKSGGKVLSGLTKRREREATLFLKGAREDLKKLEDAQKGTPAAPAKTGVLLQQTTTKSLLPPGQQWAHVAPGAHDAPYCPSFFRRNIETA